MQTDGHIMNDKRTETHTEVDLYIASTDRYTNALRQRHADIKTHTIAYAESDMLTRR